MSFDKPSSLSTIDIVDQPSSKGIASGKTLDVPAAKQLGKASKSSDFNVSLDFPSGNNETRSSIFV